MVGIVTDDMPQEARATVYDVASLAGVSHMTVSRVVNGHANVRSATRNRVLAAITELDYRPSEAARSLGRQRASVHRLD